MHGTVLKIAVSADNCLVSDKLATRECYLSTGVNTILLASAVHVILHFRWPVTNMYCIRHIFIAVLYLSIISLGKPNQDCDQGQYYDPNTDMCHPCSDCSDGRPGNIYCERGCKGEAEFVL